MGSVVIDSFAVGPLAGNCSIVMDQQSAQAAVIDPGGDAAIIIERLDALKANVCAIVHTHPHIDHVGATVPLMQHTGLVGRIHESDRDVYNMMQTQAAMLGVPAPATSELEGDLVDDMVIAIGELELAVLHTPGHTPGSLSYMVHTDAGSCVFSGDTLFRRSIGRSDLWGGDPDQLLQSIHERLLSLDDDTRVITGHGPETTIGQERRSNPYLNQRHIASSRAHSQTAPD